MARRLGLRIAQLHKAGFAHGDLYAKHVLVRPGGTFTFLDWQRCGPATPTARARDLATLHATLADEAASPRERLAVLRAYCGAMGCEMRPVLREVLRQAKRLLGRRHVREKRGAGGGEQAWVCRDGEALCLTPSLDAALPGDAADWLSLDRQPVPADEGVVRRWVDLAGGRALLERRRGRAETGHQREAMLLWRLERHGVAAPRLLAYGRREAGGRVDSFLLTEPAADTVPLALWLRRRPAGRRAVVLRELGATLAKMHEGCCYLGARGVERLAVCVGRGEPTSGEHPHDGSASHREALSAFAGAPLGGSPLHVALTSAADLAASRRPSPRRAAADLADVRRALGCSRDEWRAVMLAYRPDADRSLWSRLFHGWRRTRCHPDWPLAAGAEWADSVMTRPVTDRFATKQGRSTGRLALPGLVVYLKRHYHLPFARRLLALLWPEGDWSPAMQEYENLLWARRQGVPVPRPVAAGEFIGPDLRLRSFLAVEELTGMLPLSEAIPLAAARLAPADFLRWKRGLVAELARLARALHDRRHFHKDLYLCHFFVRADDLAAAPPSWRGRVWLIDLHRLARHRRAWPVWAVKDLAQMLYSSDVPGVTARDRLRFWRHYRPAGGWFWRAMGAAVRFKWRRYVHHNRKRQDKE